MVKMAKDTSKERMNKGALDHGATHGSMGGCARPIYINIYKYFGAPL